MGPLVWEVRKKYGWATERVDGSTPGNHTPYDICYVTLGANGLWRGGYLVTPTEEYVEFPGEYPLEELKAILETTVTLLSEEK